MSRKRGPGDEEQGQGKILKKVCGGEEPHLLHSTPPSHPVPGTSWPSLAVIKHHIQKQLERKRSIVPWCLQSTLGGFQSRNLQAGIEEATMQECCFLACSLWLTQPAFRYYPQPPPWDGIAYNGLGSPHQT